MSSSSASSSHITPIKRSRNDNELKYYFETIEVDDLEDDVKVVLIEISKR